MASLGARTWVAHLTGLGVRTCVVLGKYHGLHGSCLVKNSVLGSMVDVQVNFQVQAWKGFCQRLWVK
jgi:hypothetical protein